MKHTIKYLRKVLKPPLRLSVIVVMYNMRREAERTLYSLSRIYQKGIKNLSYEVCVVDNGSQEPLGEDFVKQFGDNFHYHYLENAPPSPAFAINFAARKTSGDIIAVMIDGAHMLTPGVLRYAMQSFQIYPNPVVATRYWFLGPGQQGDTIQDGYNQKEEDRLLQSINWPENGYRLFNIGVFIQEDRTGWLGDMFESNCLFMRRRTFDAINGVDERYDVPGGGFANIDLFNRAAQAQGATLVTILGEATFHQFHGGTTTNIIPEKRIKLVQTYWEKYEKLHGHRIIIPKAPLHYVGHMPRQALTPDNAV